MAFCGSWDQSDPKKVAGPTAALHYNLQVTYWVSKFASLKRKVHKMLFFSTHVLNLAEIR